MPASLEFLHVKREAIDTIIAKALKLSELSQMAKVEVNLREFMHAAWAKRAKKATKEATSMAKNGSTSASIVAKINKTMAGWAGDIVPTYEKSVRKIYRLGRKVAWKRGTGKIKGKNALAMSTENFSDGTSVIKAAGDVAEVFPGFDVVDEGAVDALNGQNSFWVGEHYAVNVSESIATVVKETIIQHGANRAVAGKVLQKALQKQFGIVNPPGGYTGSSKSYFEGLAANAATTARVSGQLRSFEQLDFTELEVVNPDDERTSPQCRHMNGKVFTVEQARAQMDEVLAADSPDDVKSAQPWLDIGDMKDASPKAGDQGAKDAQALADAGVVLPPYHFRCRTTIDIK